MNYEDIKIDQKVKFKGSCAVGICVGTIVKIFPPDEWIDYAGIAIIRPDSLPNLWPYDSDMFAADFDEIQPIENIELEERDN